MQADWEPTDAYQSTYDNRFAAPRGCALTAETPGDLPRAGAPPSRWLAPSTTAGRVPQWPSACGAGGEDRATDGRCVGCTRGHSLRRWCRWWLPAQCLVSSSPALLVSWPSVCCSSCDAGVPSAEWEADVRRKPPVGSARIPPHHRRFELAGYPPSGNHRSLMTCRPTSPSGNRWRGLSCSWPRRRVAVPSGLWLPKMWLQR